MIGKIIRNSYDNIEEFDECFTIHFADIDSIGLNLDVVPAVHESEAVIERIRIKADDNVKQLVDTFYCYSKLQQMDDQQPPNVINLREMA